MSVRREGLWCVRGECEEGGTVVCWGQSEC